MKRLLDLVVLGIQKLLNSYIIYNFKIGRLKKKDIKPLLKENNEVDRLYKKTKKVSQNGS